MGNILSKKKCAILLCIMLLLMSGCRKELDNIDDSKENHITEAIPNINSEDGSSVSSMQEKDTYKSQEELFTNQERTTQEAIEQSQKEAEESTGKETEKEAPEKGSVSSTEAAKPLSKEITATGSAATNANTETNKSSADSIPENTPTNTPTSTLPNTAAPKPTHTDCSFNGGKETTPSSCNAEGVKTYTCTVCGKTKTESIGKTAHNYTTQTTAATCTTEGNTKTACTMCGAVQTESKTPPTGHNFQEQWWGAEPTCTNGGDKYFVCTTCSQGSGVWESVAPLPHVPDGGTEVKHGNCMSDTVIEYYCTECGWKTGEDRYNEFDEHSWTTGVIDGNTITYCSVCTSRQ